MSSVFKKTGISEQEQREISTIVFVKLAESGELDEAVITDHPKLFIEWNENWTGKAGAGISPSGRMMPTLWEIKYLITASIGSLP